jgi:hypothetical protein
MFGEWAMIQVEVHEEIKLCHSDETRMWNVSRKPHGREWHRRRRRPHA